MTVDFMRLAKCLKDAGADLGVEITNRKINPYLLEHVILPFLNGIEVDMGTLDYSAFSSDDIMEADKEIDAVSNGAGRVVRVMEFFKKAPPTARQSKAFC